MNSKDLPFTSVKLLQTAFLENSIPVSQVSTVTISMWQNSIRILSAILTYLLINVMYLSKIEKGNFEGSGSIHIEMKDLEIAYE